GGGGSPENGLKKIQQDLENGRKILFKDIKEIDDDSWTATTFHMGSAAPDTQEWKKDRESLGLIREIIERPLLTAIEELEHYTTMRIDTIVPIEVGGGNTSGPLDVAVRMGKNIVDGDYSARAVPEITQTSPHLHNKNLAPLSCVDLYGNFVFIKETTNNFLAERLGKLFSQAAHRSAGEAGILLNGKEMKKVIQPGTLSRAFTVGKEIGNANQKGSDPVKAAVESSNGFLLFEGLVEKKEWEDRNGYLWGNHFIKGTDKFKGHHFKIWFKNENHVSWLDDEPYVTSPDIIEIIRKGDGDPITNASLTPGTKVAVIGIRANPIFRSEDGVNVLGPKHFGFDFNYKPIESIV
ncbi:MAG: DUF917 domain-containing protein, partial [Thermoplasmatales archaeon]